jgi:hypothetical protein
MFVDVTNLKKDALCTFIPAAAALGVHPAPKVGTEGIQSAKILKIVLELVLDAENLALEQKVHYWLSISQRLSRGLYNTSEFETIS